MLYLYSFIYHRVQSSQPLVRFLALNCLSTVTSLCLYFTYHPNTAYSIFSMFSNTMATELPVIVCFFYSKWLNILQKNILSPWFYKSGRTAQYRAMIVKPSNHVFNRICPSLCFLFLMQPSCVGTATQACPLNYSPVCGSNGVTYPNECALCIYRLWVSNIHLTEK